MTRPLDPPGLETHALVAPGLVGLNPSWRIQGLGDVPEGDWFLSEVERAALARFALPKRRADFRLGRWTAKRAVIGFLRGRSPFDGRSESGGGPAEARVSIVAAADGAPEVCLPDGAANVAVSIAHSGGRGLAVAGPGDAVFGADLETIEPRGPDFVADYFTAAERAWVESLDAAHRPWGATLVWSAKEAALKALRVGLREDTRAVEVTVPVASPVTSFHRVSARHVETGRGFEGSARVLGGQVVTIVASRPAPSRCAFE